MKSRIKGAIKCVLLSLVFLMLTLLVPPLLAFLAFVLLVRHLTFPEKKPVTKPYRSGSTEVSPETVVASSGPLTITINYHVGPEGIRKGGAIRLYPGRILRFGPAEWKLCLQWSNGWGSLQARNPTKPGFVAASVRGADADIDVSLLEHGIERTQLRWLKRKFLQKLRIRLARIDPKEAFLDCQKVEAVVTRGNLEEGSCLSFELGRGTGIELPKGPMQTDYAIEVDPSGIGDFRLEEAVPTVTATGGRPCRLEVIAPSTVSVGDRLKVLVRCLDENGILTPEFCGQLQVSSCGPIEAPQTVLMPEGDGTAWFQAIATGAGPGKITANNRGGDICGTSNPVLCGDSNRRLLWGDLHNHSIISDGTQEPWFYYHRSRRLLGRDFSAIPEHDIWSLGEEHSRTPDEVRLMTRVANDYYVPGEFVTLHAFEWTQHRLGHRNVLYGPGEKPEVLSHADQRYATPAQLLGALEGRKAMVIPHHPAWKTHHGEMYFDYGPRGNPLQRLVEVYSRHGNSEFYGCPCPISHLAKVEGVKGKLLRFVVGDEFAGPSSGSYVRDALANGYRLGLIAGSDEHYVAADPRKGPGLVYGGGLTGAYAFSVTRESVFDALWERYVCGTTGKRIIMHLLVNGHPQGSEIVSDEAPRLTGRVIGTSALELVEIVKFDSGGFRTPWQDGGNPEVLIDFTDTRFHEDSFYYLRVVQEDGHMGWAGPVWVDRRKP